MNDQPASLREALLAGDEDEANASLYFEIVISFATPGHAITHVSPKKLLMRPMRRRELVSGSGGWPCCAVARGEASPPKLPTWVHGATIEAFPCVRHKWNRDVVRTPF